MTDRIEPALSAEEWDILREQVTSNEGVAAWLDECYAPDGVGAVRILAAMNYRLPDSDPRKITRETIRTLREAASRLRSPSAREAALYALTIAPTAKEGNEALQQSIDAKKEGNMLERFADALESYLPPE